MSQYPTQRGARRFLVAERLGVGASAALEVRLVDLSTTGARIEHYAPLHPGSVCAFEFPAALGSLVLSVRVVHTTVVGAEEKAEGESLGRYQSGLMFTEVTADQQAALAAILDRLGPGSSPEDRGQHS